MIFNKLLACSKRFVDYCPNTQSFSTNYHSRENSVFNDVALSDREPTDCASLEKNDNSTSQDRNWVENEALLHYLRENNILYPSGPERMYITKRFQVTIDTLNHILTSIREQGRYFNDNSKNGLTQDEVKSILNEWIQSRSFVSNSSTEQGFIDISQTFDQNREEVSRMPAQAYPSAKDLHLLSIRTGLSKKKIQKLIYRLLDPKGTISKKNREIVLRFLKSVGFRKPTFEEYNELSMQTGLGKFQLYAIVDRQLDKLGIISEDVTSYIKNWLESRPNARISSDDYKFLSKETKLARRQIYHIIKLMKDPKGKLTKEKRKQIQERYIEGMKDKKSLSVLVKEIRVVEKVSERQIRSIIRSLQFKSVTLSKKRVIWTFCNKMKGPLLKEDELQLSHDTNLLPSQVRKLVKQFHTKNSLLTSEAKDFIKKWLNCNQWKEVQQDDIEYLHSKVQVDRNRIKTYISRLRDSSKVISIKQWHSIKKWLHSLPIKEQDDIQCGIITFPLKTKLSTLSSQVQLSIDVIISSLMNIDNPPGIITDGNRKYIQEFLKQNKYLLENEHIEHLQSITNLTRKQVQSQIHSILRSSRKVSTEKRDAIFQWATAANIQNINQVTEENIDELQEVTGEKRNVIRTLLDRFCDYKSSIKLDMKHEKKCIEDLYYSVKNQKSLDIIEYIHQKTGYNLERIRNVVRELRYKESAVPITEEIKESIRAWLQHNSFNKPNKLEFAELLQSTGISPRQLHNQIQYQMKKTTRK